MITTLRPPEKELRIELNHTLTALFRPDDLLELRVFRGRSVRYVGYFTEQAALVDAVARLERSKDEYTYYIVLNEIQREALARGIGLKSSMDTTATSDDIITKRRFLLIDVDPERMTGISAKDDEKERAALLASDVKEYLYAWGFSEPFMGDTGNGYALLYPLDLPTGPKVDSENTLIIQRFLKALNKHFEGFNGAHIDPTVHNPSRIFKLLGTVARKGENAVDLGRPHRQSKLLSIPPERVPVDLNLIAAVAGNDEVNAPKAHKHTGERVDAEAWLIGNGLNISKTKQSPKGTTYELNECPWNPAHTNGSAYVTQFADTGKIIAGCHHAGCVDNHWRELCRLYEDDLPTSVDADTSVKIREWYDTWPKRNQEEVASLFISLRDDVLFLPEYNRWMLYNGSNWELDVLGEVDNFLTQMIKGIIEVVDDDKPKDDDEDGKQHKKRYLSWAIHLNNRHAIDGILRFAKRKHSKRVDTFDSDDFTLNVGDRTLNLKTGRKHPHRAKDYLMLLTSVPYDPDAKYEQWDEYLLETFKRPQLIKWIQKVAGMSITGDTTEEITPLLYGAERTGKSTFYEPVIAALGDYARYMNFDTLKRSGKGSGGSPREDLLRLRGCRIAMCSEVNRDEVFDTALSKKIASGETISARGIHALDTIQYTPKFKVWLGTNYQPKIAYDDGGAFRRFKVVPFLNKIPENEVDKSLKRDLKTNPAAQMRILAWLVEGCKMWIREGLNDVPREVKRAGDEFRRKMNPIGLFLEDYCVLDHTAKITVQKLTDEFNYVRGEYGVADELKPRSIGRYMLPLGYERWRDNTSRGYEGIRKKTQIEIDNEVEFYDLEDANNARIAEKEQFAALRVVEAATPLLNNLVTCDVWNGVFNCVYKKSIEQGHDAFIKQCKKGDSNVKRHLDLTTLATETKSILQDLRKTRNASPVFTMSRSGLINGVTAKVFEKIAKNEVDPNNRAYVQEAVEKLATEKEIEELIVELTTDKR
jgi:P4 family phage/plasmid primase-like protien